VILLRGWFGVFSTGLDAIADALKAKGIRAEVAGHLQWKTAADEIRRERAQGKTDAIVLVGHSQGLTTSSTWLGCWRRKMCRSRCW
jgi:hypothetical protein